MSDEKKQSTLGEMADRAQEMVGGMVGMGTAATAGSVDAATFLENAAIGNAYELEAGRLALSRARSPHVLELVREMLDDHMTAHHHLRSTLRSMPDAPALPDRLDARRAQMIDHLRQASDDSFESRFVEQQIMAHQENITLFQGYSATGNDPRLKLFAAGALPSLERHLQMAMEARRH